MSSLFRSILFKEVKEILSSPLFYLFIAIYCFISGGIFYSNLIGLQEITNKTVVDSVLAPTFTAINFLLIFFTPVLAMNSFIEEKREETFNFLLLSRLSYSQIYLAKFFAGVLAGLLMIGTTLLFPLSLAFSGFDDWGMIFPYLSGILLLFCCYYSVGMFSSLISKNALICIVLSFAILFSLMILFTSAAMISNPLLSQIISYFSFGQHVAYFAKGAIASFDLIYMFSFVSFFAVSTIKIMEVRG